MKRNNNDIHRYDDIINLPHHVSKNHPQMDTLNRAAQFSPFAALTGYDEAIEETARLTDSKIELDEVSKASLDEKLRIIQEQLSNRPEITITYFQRDEKKDGGAYISVSGVVKKIDYFKRVLIMQDGSKIEIDDINNIRGETIRAIEDIL